MDLNKAMVDLYKRSSVARMSSRISNKSGRRASHTLKNKDTIVGEDATDSPKKKPTTIEGPIAAVDFTPKTTFDQLYGVEYVRGEIVNIVDQFKRFVGGTDKKVNRPFLICGSPGIGKTSLVEAAANYADLKLITIQLKRMVRQTRNEFKESLEQLVRHSMANQPAIVLVDDLERIVDKEESRNLICDSVERLLDEQLKLLVFCTVSSTLDVVSDIDFLYTLQLKRPSSDARLKILESLRNDNESLSNLTDDCLECIATTTPSFTALDLRGTLDLARIKSRGMPTLHHCIEAVEIRKQSFKKGTHLIGEKPSVTWNDIGGMVKVRQDFVGILRQIRRAGRNCKFGGIALYGPPGCGKTMVAQAMANEAGFNFISIKPFELVDKFLGETEKNIRRVFQEAREYEPCMIYFDEFDGLCGTRGNKNNMTSSIETLLSEMDGFVDRGQSIVLVSTNRLEDIDPAMKRPGRLTKHIYVGPPDQKARRDILKVITNRPWLSLAEDVDLDFWAKKTDGFTGADLDFLVSEANERAMVELSSQNDVTESVEDQVTLRQVHFEYAMNTIHEKNEELAKKITSINNSTNQQHQPTTCKRHKFE